MKSSTLRRSNITREKIAMLSALSDYNTAKGRSNAHITDKQAELDMLWQNFKIATSERSPKTYFSAGFFIGVVMSLLAALFISFFIGYSPLSNLNFSAPKSAKENVKFTFIPADKQVPAEEEAAQKPMDKEYTVQAGDSLEDISVRFYGKYDEAKIKAIQVKNELKNINSIKIGQKLIIPMD